MTGPTYPGKQWGNDKTNANDAPDWAYINEGTFESWYPPLAYTFSSAANSGVFIPDSPVLVYNNTHIITFSSPANSAVFTPDQNNDAHSPSTINPSLYLSNSEAILINGNAFTTLVVNTTAFTVTVNTGFAFTNAEVRLAVAAINVATLLANAQSILVDSSPFTTNVVNSTAFTANSGNLASGNTPGFTYAPVQTLTGSNVNHLTDGTTPNTYPTESGWRLVVPGAQEILVALDGLEMPNVVAVFGTNLSGTTLNATGQLLRVQLQLNQGVVVTDANAANVYIVAQGSGLTANANLVYDTGILSNTFSSVANSGIFTADYVFTVNNYIYVGETLHVGNTPYTVNAVNSTAFTVVRGNSQFIPGVANAVVAIYPALSFPRSGLLTFDIIADLSADVVGSTFTVNSTSILHGKVVSYKQKDGLLYANNNTNTVTTNLTGANAVVITIS